MDVLNAEHAIKKYGDLFPAFADSRECKFVKVKSIRGKSQLLLSAMVIKDLLQEFWKLLEFLLMLSHNATI